MRFFLVLALFVCFLTRSSYADSVLNGFPKTVQEISAYKEEAVKDFMVSLAAYKAQPKDELNFAGVVVLWHKMIESFFAKVTLLNFTFLITDEPKAIQASKNEAAAMAGVLLQQACLDADCLSLFLDYANKVSGISPAERYWVYTLVESAVEGWPESHPLWQRACEIKNKLAEQEMVPFTYIRGNAAEKTLASGGVVSVLNWNVCFFNHNLSMIFGGVLPWKDRISKVCLKIEECDADLVCLQEVFSQEASVQLQELLKEKYAHFYVNIGPKLCGFDFRALGIPSGLFVASKYPIKDPHFQPFNAKETPKNRGYGFFTADLTDREVVIARVASTHLQPGQTDEDMSYRSAQLNALLSNLRAKDRLGIPCFLCGDLNLERGGEEYQKLLRNFINSDLGSDWTCCELRNYWWKAGQNVKKFAALGLDVEWIDYFLQLKSGMRALPAMTTRVIAVNDLKNPKSSLSDHQILMTFLNLKKASTNE